LEFGESENVTPEILARLARHSDHPYIIEQYKEWYERNNDLLSRLGRSGTKSIIEVNRRGCHTRKEHFFSVQLSKFNKDYVARRSNLSAKAE
jgi:hypothetical protein